MSFYAEHTDIAYGKRIIVEDLSVEIPAGKITALIGANGSGKSTILKTMCRLMAPVRGQIVLDGKAIHSQPTKELAKRLSVLPQNPEAPEGLTVKELISYGRSPHKAGFGRLNQKDEEIIARAMKVTSITEFAQRPLDQLSGGQRQRAWIAMCIAQDTDIMFLDEPTTFLDMAHQLEVMKLLKKLNEEFGRTIVMIVHDLNHATRFADHIIAIKAGKIVSQGTPQEVVTAQVCREVFGVVADILTDAYSGKPLCVPIDTVLGTE